MKKQFILSAVVLLSLGMGACSSNASSPEGAASATAEATAESGTSTATTESSTQSPKAADKEACESFEAAAKTFNRPTVDPNKEPEKYMEALKPLAAPAYQAAEKANDPHLKEAFKAMGTMSENGLKTDPKIAQNMDKYVLTMLKTCQSVGVNTDAMVGK